MPKIKTHTFELYAFFTLFVLYFSQGWLYASGSIISQLILLILMLWGGVCLVHTLQQRKKPICANLMVIFTIMLLATYIISPKEVVGSVVESIGRHSTFGQFKEEMAFCLMFFIGYTISPKIVLSKNTLIIIAIACASTFALSFIESHHTLTLTRNVKETTINIAYYFILLLPLLALTLKRHKILTFIIIGICIFFVMWGAKRGAIVCLGISLCYLFYWYNKNVRHSWTQKIIISIIFIGAIAFAVYQYTQNDYLQDRMDKTEKSGIGPREIGYSMMFNHWLNDDSLLTIIFGNGTAQTITVWGNYGHNDWLELLIDNGAVGVLLYLSLFISFLYHINKTIRDPYKKLAGTLCILIWFIKSLFSMGYTAAIDGFLTFILGLIICDNKPFQNTRHIVGN